MKFGPDDEQCGRGCTEDAPQFQQDVQCNYNAPRPTRNTWYPNATVVSYIITVQYTNLEPTAWKTPTIHRFVEDIRTSTSHVRNHFKCLKNHYRVHIMKHMIRKHWNSPTVSYTYSQWVLDDHWHIHTKISSNISRLKEALSTTQLSRRDFATNIHDSYIHQ